MKHFILALFFCGCGGQEPAPTPDENLDSTGIEESDILACEEGEVKDCLVTMPQHGSVTTCFSGMSICENGRWTECEVVR